jgi:twitching motility two-component system response regulator PilG
MAHTDHSYSIDVIGFNQTERLMLSSIFGLAARRDPSFVQRDAGATRPADLYLVDGSDTAAMSEFRAVHARFPAPAVLIGDGDVQSGFPALPRPLQWARLLQSFDDAVLNTVQPALARSGAPAVEAAGGYDKTMVLRRTSTPSPAAASPAKRAAAPALPRAKQISDSVLVVDDNATVRKFMEAKLAPYGFSADFAETGEQAVGLTGTKEYTCVFLDVVLPGIDGYQVCKLIKSNKQAVKRTAVVMLTSRSSPFDKLRGSLAGCDEYLTKPVDENQLLEVIAKFLPSARAAAA